MRPEELFDRVERRTVRRMLPAVADAADVAGSSDALEIEVAARAAWASLAEPGDSVAAVLADRLGAPGALAAVVSQRPVADLAADLEPEGPERAALHRALDEGIARWRPRLDRGTLLRRLSAAEGLGVRLVHPTSQFWPAGLDDLGPHTPFVLWVRGDPQAPAASRAVAVVGARAATGYGEHVAAELAAGMAERGASVVSGAAYGIDGVAHRAALGAAGSTVAYLAGGSDRLYPSGHSAMLERLIATPGCAVVSELPPGSSPTRWRFLQRNRLIAAASAVTVVVEAGARSGSLNTAGHAAAMGRPLGAVPGPVTSASSAGCHRLLREFDATCVCGVDDLLELLGGGAESLLPAAEQDPTSTRVLDAVRGRGGRLTEEVAAAAGLSVQDALAALGLLLAEGAVARADDGRWRRATR